MAISWPPSLPIPFDLDTFTETGPTATQRFQADAGPGKVRRFTTAAADMIATGFTVPTPADRLTFVTWYRDVIKHGSLPFQLVHPIEGDLRNWRFSPRPYLIRPLGGGAFLISLELELLPS